MGRIRNDLLLVLVLLSAAGIGWLALRPAGGGVQAVVTVDGGEIARYSLLEDREVRLEAGEGYTCVGAGWIGRQGEAVICLPHRLVVYIEGGGAPALDAAAN